MYDTQERTNRRTDRSEVWSSYLDHGRLLTHDSNLTMTAMKPTNQAADNKNNKKRDSLRAKSYEPLV